MSTLVWMSIVLAIGSVSKSSMLAALFGIGVWFGLMIAQGILSVFSNQAWVLAYAPGEGALGTLNTNGSANQTSILASISTGTEAIATNFITYILNPTANVTFFRIEFDPSRGADGMIVPLHTEPLSLVVARSIAVAAVYILVFNFIAWFALKRAQIAE